MLSGRVSFVVLFLGGEIGSYLRTAYLGCSLAVVTRVKVVSVINEVFALSIFWYLLFPFTINVLFIVSISAAAVLSLQASPTFPSRHIIVIMINNSCITITIRCHFITIASP